MVFIRDRTNLFISYRQSYTHHPIADANDSLNNFRDPLMGDEAIEMEDMPPQWLDLTAQTDRALDQIRSEMAQLQPLYKKNALPGFDDRSAVEKQIEVLTVAVTRGLNRCRALVKAFGDIAKSQQEHYLKKMADNIQMAMAAKVQDCTTQFRQMQSAYLKALQQDELGDLPGMIAGNTPLQTIDDDVQLSQMALERGQQYQQQQLAASSSFEDAETLHREQGISRVADTILEVAEIFRDLQTMVIDQGALIDRIDYNIENTVTQVKGADKQLMEGSRYQKRTQKCKIILLLVLLVVGLVLVLIFKPHRRHEIVYEEHRPVPVTESKPSSTATNAASSDPTMMFSGTPSL